MIRATRGNVFIYSFDMQVDLEDQIIGDKYDQNKTVFVLAYQEGSSLQDKIRRICSSFPIDAFDIHIDRISEEL